MIFKFYPITSDNIIVYKKRIHVLQHLKYGNQSFGNKVCHYAKRNFFYNLYVHDTTD